ncbi:hypothetical protein N7522_002563 [Penicillium canescens]|nr:hypothetical protein N7522_002563 [Penicillium canescens]
MSSSSPHDRLSSISSHIMGSSNPSVFTAATVAAAPEDPLFGLMKAYREDPSDKKVDLGIGAYRDNNAKPWILPVVKKADNAIHNDPNLNHEYLSIGGLADFTSAAQKLIVGADSAAIKEKRICTLQTISGTGAVHLGGLFLSKFHPQKPTIYLSNPTWANHNQIFTNVNLPIAKYPYFHASTKGLDFEGMMQALTTAPDGSIILLHACAHNPTGVDPTQDQWKQIAAVMRALPLPLLRHRLPRLRIRRSSPRRLGNPLLRRARLRTSFAKNFGLYGERTGAFHFVSAPGPDAAASSANIASQLAILQRSEISNPPAYGARIASRVLNDPVLFAEWEDDLRTMSGRILEMRAGLRERLEKRGTPGDWSHITSQIGMFSFTGLTEAQVLTLREKWHVYMTKNGRISMAGLNTHNIDYFAEAVDSVVRGSA